MKGVGVASHCVQILRPTRTKWQTWPLNRRLRGSEDGLSDLLLSLAKQKHLRLPLILGKDDCQLECCLPAASLSFWDVALHLNVSHCAQVEQAVQMSILAADIAIFPYLLNGSIGWGVTSINKSQHGKQTDTPITACLLESQTSELQMPRSAFIGNPRINGCEQRSLPNATAPPLRLLRRFSLLRLLGSILYHLLIPEIGGLYVLST